MTKLQDDPIKILAIVTGFLAGSVLAGINGFGPGVAFLAGLAGSVGGLFVLHDRRVKADDAELRESQLEAMTPEQRQNEALIEEVKALRKGQITLGKIVKYVALALFMSAVLIADRCDATAAVVESGAHASSVRR